MCVALLPDDFPGIGGHISWQVPTLIRELVQVY